MFESKQDCNKKSSEVDVEIEMPDDSAEEGRKMTVMTPEALEKMKNLASVRMYKMYG